MSTKIIPEWYKGRCRRIFFCCLHCSVHHSFPAFSFKQKSFEPENDWTMYFGVLRGRGDHVRFTVCQWPTFMDSCLRQRYRAQTFVSRMIFKSLVKLTFRNFMFLFLNVLFVVKYQFPNLFAPQYIICVLIRQVENTELVHILVPLVRRLVLASQPYLYSSHPIIPERYTTTRAENFKKPEKFRSRRGNSF